jgi:hypothetical protein
MGHIINILLIIMMIFQILLSLHMVCIHIYIYIRLLLYVCKHFADHCANFPDIAIYTHGIHIFIYLCMYVCMYVCM